MKLEKQVCNLELAKKLKKLGAKQESLFYWVDGSLAVNSKREIPEVFIYSNEANLWENPDRLLGEFSQDKVFSAFTCAELGEMLPDELPNEECEAPIGFGKTKNSYITTYFNEGGDFPRFEAKTEANSRAKCLIYLIENKLLKGEK